MENCMSDKHRDEYVAYFKRYKATRIVGFVCMCVSSTVAILASDNVIIRLFGTWLFAYGITRFIQFLDVRESQWHNWSVVPRKLKVNNVSKLMINNDTYSIIYLNHKKIKLEIGKTYNMEYLSHTHGRYIVKAEEVEENK